MKLTPVDYDPFESTQAAGPVLTPVDFDPFAPAEPVITDQMAGDSIDLGVTSVAPQAQVVEDVPALDADIPPMIPQTFPRISGPDINDLIDPGRRTREFESFLTEREIPHGDIPETMRTAPAPTPFRNIMNSVFGDPDAVDPEAQAESLIEFEALQQGIPAKELVANVGPKIGIAERLGKDFRSGAVSTGSGLLGYASRLTGNTGLRAGQIKADEIADELMAVNPAFVDKLAAGFGSTATFFIPGIGIAKGAQAAAAVSPRFALWLGSSASAGLEAAVEAGDVYNQLLNKGFTDEEAAERADKAFWANAALVGVTNRLGLFSDAGNALQRRTMGALFEGVGQELPQQVISNLATDRPAFEGGGEAAAIGSIVGGTFAGNTRISNEQAQPAERMPPRTIAQPELNTEVFQQQTEQNDFAQRPRAVSDAAGVKLVLVEGNPFAQNTQSEAATDESARVEQPEVQAVASKEAATLNQVDEFELSAPEGAVPESSNVSDITDAVKSETTLKEETDVVDTMDTEYAARREAIEEEESLENERDYIEKQLPQFYTQREIATFQRQTAKLSAQETVDFYAGRYDEGAKRGKPRDTATVAKLDTSTIEDLGEKIGGAKKDLAKSLQKEYSDDEIASLPLSKIWPKSDVDTIEDTFTAALATAARAEIPSKPRRTHKVSAWVGKVKAGRNLLGWLSKQLEERKISHQELLDRMRDRAKHGLVLEGFAAKVDLLQGIDRQHWGRIGRVDENAGASRYEKTEDGLKEIPSPHVRIQIDGRMRRYDTEQATVASVLDKVKADLDGESAVTGKPMKFEIRGRAGSYAINKTGDREYRKLKTFDDLAKAREFMSDNHSELVQAWEAVKERDNVKKSDMRSKENRPRTGKDHREGEDVTGEGFMEAFGFRGVEFGNWVKQGKNAKERQGMLNQAYDALMDLADIVGIPAEAVSLNGELGLGFGSRGTGHAAAHYEPGLVVINLTKTQGAGSLAHEWFHALDHYFQRKRGETGLNRETTYITYNPETYYEGPRGGRLAANEFERAVAKKPSRYRVQDPSQWRKVEGVRPEVETAFAKVVESLNASPMKGRAEVIDKGKVDGYWSRIIERAARSFENYTIHKMVNAGYHNDYLANVASIEEFSRDPGRYPYLLDDEIDSVAEAFDNLFDTIETKKTDKGTALFSRRRQGDGDIYEFAAQAWEALATGNDRAFQQPKSLAKELREIARDINVDLSAEVLDVSGKPGLRAEWAINTGGKKAFIRENVDGTIEMNVASLVSGKSRGSEIYNLAATYAHNNGKVFIGDREGLSDDAVYRRTENMLSSALKFGTTRHLRPHPRQKLDWTENPQTNLENLIKKHYTNITEQVPLLEDIVYDFDLQHFVTKGTDQEVTARQFRQLSNTAGGKAAKAGPATLKRAAVTNALLQEKDSGRRRGILASLSRQRHSERRIDPQLKDILYSKKPGQSAGLSVSDVEQVIAPTILNWSDAAPRVEVVQSLDDIPEHIVDADVHDGDTIEAVYDEQDGAVYLVASQIESVERAQVVLAHEAVGHYGMEEMLGKEFQPVLERVQWLKKSGDKRVRELADEVRKHHGELDKNTEAREIIAVMAEQGIKHPIMSRVVAALKDFLRKLGFKMQFTAADLEAMVARAARFVESGKGRSEKTEKTGRRSTSRAMFSRKPEDTLDDIDEAASQATTGAEWVDAVKSKAFDDTRPAWLAGLTRRHIADIGSDVFPQLETYVNLAQKMDAERNELVNQAADIADRWTKFASSDSVAADGMASLMHDSTVAGVDPSEAYTPLIEKEEAKNRLSLLALQAKETSGQAYIYVNRAKEVKRMLGFEKSRAPKYADLKRRYDALPDDAKTLFKDVRDMYAERHDKMMTALQERIDRAEVSAQEKRKLKEQIRIQFENQKAQAPYFPLARFGDFWVSAKKGDDTEFYMYASSHEQKKNVRKLREQGYDVSSGKRIENVKALHGASESFVTEIVGVINKVGQNGKMSGEISDAVYQLYLSTLPDLSVRKNFIHRKKTTGFSADALRAFASQSFHGSYQLAKLRFSDQLQGALENMREHIPYSKDSNKASDIYNEMQKRHEWAMNPTSAPWANTVTSVAFVWYLGITPSAALVNTSQTALVALPVLASKHGYAKSGAELLKASKDYFAGGAGPKKGMFSMEHVLKGEELLAYKALVDDGVIDKTRAHDLIGVAETPSKVYSSGKDKAMRIVSFLFHHAERYNREATGLAAYRLARKAGDSHQAAIDYARDVVFESHFDYSNANKARFMQNDAAKVLLIFRQYSLNMTYLLARSAHQSLKGESAEVRSEARKKLAGVLSLHAVAAGAYGLPLFWVVEGIMNAVFDDEDEPWDFRTEARNFLADYFGEDAADTITMGPVNKATGVNIHSRVSLNELWFRSPDRDLEGKAYVQYWFEQIAGPAGSMATGVGRGYDLMREGHISRGIEAMTPKAIRDGLKALRYADEGVTTLRGDQVVDDLSAFELWAQGIGFTPSEVAKQYDANRALRNYANRTKDRRKLLINRWWLATRSGDGDGRDEAMDSIREFNRKNPRHAITKKSLKQSAKTRRRISAESRNGLSLRKRDRHLRDRVRFADD